LLEKGCGGVGARRGWTSKRAYGATQFEKNYFQEIMVKHLAVSGWEGEGHVVHDPRGDE
jgi:hypothetical protein